MQKLSIAVFVGGLALLPLSAVGQDLASAPSASPIVRTDHLVFLESNGSRVPDSAMETVRSAAEAAKRSPIRVEGRPEYANAVKRELVRQGAPASAVRVSPVPVQPLPTADGLSVPTDRGVVLQF